MIIETEGRKRIVYNDAVLVRRRNSKVVIKKRQDGKAIFAQFVRVATEKIKKKHLCSNQHLVKRMGITILVTNIALTQESLNDFVIAISAIYEIKNKQL